MTVPWCWGLELRDAQHGLHGRMQGGGGLYLNILRREDEGCGAELVSVLPVARDEAVDGKGCGIVVLVSCFVAYHHRLIDDSGGCLVAEGGWCAGLGLDGE